ncbi:unnamed protein product [Cuscuta epithymum]|uniref:RING-type domain-containing protein n=1 Tax=Cuscuta epithymum TaxID=186058 RepID=A0AAV0DH75_9ASTE|nr:unnamed protein product [Cuscuta epithymum]CAH9143141.1 unnamed protein product [Cuscuta epithymum]
MGDSLTDFQWSVEIDTKDGPDLQRSLVRIYLEERDASFVRTWWGDWGDWGDVLYRIEEFLDVSRECVETIDLEKILSEEEDEEELMTLFTDKVLSPFHHIVYGERLKVIASEIIRGCRDRLILLTNDNSNSKVYSISVGLSLQLFVTLGLEAWTWFQDCLVQLPPGVRDYDPSSPMPLPRMVPNGYGFFRLGGGTKLEEETCVICFGKYEPQCLVIRLQCLNELLPDPDEEHSHKAETPAAMLLPCGHIFHAKCIASWFCVSKDKPCQLSGINTCPLCRFQVPTRHFVLSLQHFFPLLYF